jgi:hypothetical protein
MPRDPSPSQSPPESPPPSQNDGAASSDDSAKGSARARSTDATAAGVFVGDPGPAFDPKAAAEAPAVAPAPGLAELPVWEEDTVRSVLTAKGAVLHAAVGVAEDDWLYLEHELDSIAPPLTRILNRYDVTRAAAEGGDALAVMIGLGGYAGRSYMTRRAELAAAEDVEPEPVTGVRAPEGTGPPADGGEAVWATPQS